ncbi:MAG: YgiQ family radical SAM protein [Bacteroidales bacterium]|nr:YgiQ family radical SAM protein [Bacteroidales bacterium]MBR1578019.1 YgiQ family radical SAM protein [Bacteroidales bacterium]
MTYPTECRIPTSVKEVERLGWDWIDVIIFTGDAFVDHPSFGTACIARYLEKAGYRVAVVPQPNWRDDLRDFRKLGAPRLYFAVNGGAMDSMVNHYTAAKRLRHDDAYTPEGKAGQRPDRAVTVYTRILKQLWPDVPVVIGGVEASLRRLTHYDYWDDRLMPSVLVDSGADWLCYGMGERPMLELTRAIEAGRNLRQIERIPQIAFYRTGRIDSAPSEEPRRTSLRSSLPLPSAAGPSHLRGHGWPRSGEALPDSATPILNAVWNEVTEGVSGDSSPVPHRGRRGVDSDVWDEPHIRRGTPSGAEPILLHSYEECCRDKMAFAENFHEIEIQANVLHPRTLIEPVGEGYVQVNPMYPPATTEEMDACWDLPFTKRPHPRYKGKRIPAYDMIKDSIITHRGCFGGCNFCTIAAHQSKFIQSRSEKSILEEVRRLAAMPEFHGNISDLGAPSANMYGMHGRNQDLCAKCRRQSCIFPKACPNLDRSHDRLLKLYRAVDAVKGVRHSYISSGVRYDLFLDEKGFLDETGKPYLQELMLRHTSGRLKVAPEHTEDKVLYYMGKPSFRLFERLRMEFDRINRENGTHTELVPYFISSHPGCRLEDMRRLAANPYLKGIWMEQVQDFMPTPMTSSSVMFWSGIDPRTMKPVFVERDSSKKKAQKALFFKKK